MDRVSPSLDITRQVRSNRVKGVDDGEENYPNVQRQISFPHTGTGELKKISFPHTGTGELRMRQWGIHLGDTSAITNHPKCYSLNIHKLTSHSNKI
jgi:hypothetical protein